MMKFFPNIKSSLLLCGLLYLTPAALAAEWNLEQLMQMLAQTHSAHASFVETKYIAMLDKPVVSSGELFYRAPDHLEKRTLKPKADTMVLDQGSLLLTRGSKEYRMQLQNYPELAAFIDSIRGTMAGDLNALETNYQLKLEGTVASWKLHLLPVTAPIKAVVQRIRISGAANDVRSIEIVQADGDRSVMAIVKMAD